MGQHPGDFWFRRGFPRTWVSARAVWIAALAIVLTTACSSPRATTPGNAAGSAPAAERKHLVAAMQSDPATISSNVVAAGSGTIQGGDALEDLVNAGLSVVNNTGTLLPQLAETVPTVDNGLWVVSPDGTMSTTWKIRPNAQWHDGAPVTSDDLLFTVRLTRDKDLPVFYDSGTEGIARMDTPDPQTLVVHWKQPYIRADSLFTRRFGFPRPAHILAALYDDPNKDLLLQSPYWNQAYVGAGPYKVRDWVADSHAVLVANDQYVLGRPKIDEVEVRFIPDSNTLAANLLAGTVEVTLGRNLSLQQAVQIRDSWKDGHVGVGIKNWMAAWPQFLNPDPPIILDPRFRRAMAYALDRQQMVETLQYSMVPVADTFLSPADPMYKQIDSQIVRYDYNPTKATALMGELGYTKGTDGIFRNGAGEPLSLEVRTDGGGGDDGQETADLAVADGLKRFGLAAEPLIITQLQRIDRGYNSTFPGIRVWRLPNDADDLRRFHSRDAPTPENKFAGGNRSRYMNPQFDEMIDRYMSTIPMANRIAAMGDVIHHMTDQVTVIGLWYNTEPVLISNRTQNITARDVGATTEAWNAQDWDVTR
ncbi:MAG: peptide/nickel transport system substrate-binding protein [Chloroflexota bacterium]|nr:peptide/nickel transport system substrate-binding protein [Chloroflexota bacterium]